MVKLHECRLGGYRSVLRFTAIRGQIDINIEEDRQHWGQTAYGAFSVKSPDEIRQLRDECIKALSECDAVAGKTRDKHAFQRAEEEKQGGATMAIADNAKRKLRIAEAEHRDAWLAEKVDPSYEWAWEHCGACCDPGPTVGGCDSLGPSWTAENVLRLCAEILFANMTPDLERKLRCVGWNLLATECEEPDAGPLSIIFSSLKGAHRAEGHADSDDTETESEQS